jgi:hypothetical protein
MEESMFSVKHHWRFLNSDMSESLGLSWDLSQAA